MQSLLERGRAYLTPGAASSQKANGAGDDGFFSTAKAETALFPKTDAAVDGDECLHDCETCTITYPRKFDVDESDKLYGHVSGWDTHLIVGTGKTDWVRDVAHEKGSVMEALEKHSLLQYERAEGRGRAKLRLSASNLPTGSDHSDVDMDDGSNCFLLPSWLLIEHVQPAEVVDLVAEVVAPSVTNKTLVRPTTTSVNDAATPSSASSLSPPPSSSPSPQTPPAHLPAPNTRFLTRTRPIPHSALILMCSHRTRDARCGQSAPLLRAEFERHLRPLGLYRDLHDERPGGVGIYFINHVGGHKYSANVIIYRKRGREYNEAVQGIWLARVRPADCENIVRYTILQGKLVKPESQLRGGFDRERGLLSW
ncbi:hypothetical protein DV735_g570, partial [Chaetothyriales sp. CBS 134920]